MISATHTLEPLADDADWQVFHEIREAVLFVARGRVGVYNPEHPDDRTPHNTPLLLKCDGRPTGTIRLDDFQDGTGCVRLVAITTEAQGQGHGRVMSQLCEARARQQGIGVLKVNSAPGAVGFYRKMGWREEVWDPAELVGIAEDCVQMTKAL